MDENENGLDDMEEDFDGDGILNKDDEDFGKPEVVNNRSAIKSSVYKKFSGELAEKKYFLMHQKLKIKMP